MTSPADELKTILQQTLSSPYIHKTHALQVVTKDGRRYETCFVVESSDNNWKAISRRSEGFYYCLECFAQLHGGDWIQITHKSGMANKTVIRLHEITLHHLECHPEKAALILASEKCKQILSD